VLIHSLSPLFWPGIVLVASAASVGWQAHDLAHLGDRRATLRDSLTAVELRLADARAASGAVTDALDELLRARAARDSVAARPMLVISVTENRLWYRRGAEVLFEARVASGSGRHLVRPGGDQWRFDTPRGRLMVERKDTEPAWVAPEWHYVEAAERLGARLVHLRRDTAVPIGGGAVIAVSGANVVTRYPDGREVPFEARDGTEIRAGNALLVPPPGTNQRRYPGVLGSHRLYIGGGYGIHGTNAPSSIGRSVSHGCIRLRNEDIEALYRLVPVGSPVYVY
jgi:hypothetical protein